MNNLKVPRDNRATISMPDESWQVASAFAHQNNLVFFRSGEPNISAAITKIISDWQKLTNFQVANDNESLAA